MTELVKMINEQGKIADVHPSEVSNFARGGYVAYDGKKAPKAAAVEDLPLPPPVSVDVKATDKAVELAADAGIDISTIVGTGRGGKVTVEDVEAAIEKLSDETTANGD